MSRPEHSSRRVWPLRLFRLSSSWRRLGSASALNTSSIAGYAAIRLLNIGSRRAACQRKDSTRRPRRPPAGPADGGTTAAVTHPAHFEVMPHPELYDPAVSEARQQTAAL